MVHQSIWRFRLVHFNRYDLFRYLYSSKSNSNPLSDSYYPNHHTDTHSTSNTGPHIHLAEYTNRL